MAILIRLFQRDEECEHRRLETLVEVGRTQMHEVASPSPGRFLIAPHESKVVPRRWFMIHRLDADNIRIDNIHANRVVEVSEPRCSIPPRGSKDVRLDRWVEIELPLERRLVIVRDCASITRVRPRPAPLDIVPEPTPCAICGSRDLAEDVNPDSSLGVVPRSWTAGNEPLRPLDVINLFRKALRVVSDAAGADHYIDMALRTALEIIDLDRVVILLPQLAGSGRDDGGIKDILSSSVFLPTPLSGQDGDGPLRSDESHRSPQDSDAALQWRGQGEVCRSDVDKSRKPPISHSLLLRALKLKTAQIHDSGRDDDGHSLSAMQSVVAAPVIDRHGRIAAVLYGDRWHEQSDRQVFLTELERILAEVLAAAVAAGMARQAAQRSEATLAEFFSPSVARKLAKYPEMLVGREADVSVLFCDIRGFSRIADLLGREQTVALINDVLSDLSQCVVDHDGVLVDYVGDELFAMWGAPEPQPDHADRAIAAARQMMLCLPRLQQRWQQLREPMLNFGIGINSGAARVGNVGSRLKFKYGVLGNTVNLGSRLQQASKRLGVDCVVSASTAEKLAQAEPLSMRRLANVRVPGFQHPAAVYQFVAEATPEWLELREQYQTALLEYESGRPGEAVHQLAKILRRFPDDMPSSQLLVETARAQSDPEEEIETAWKT